MKSLAILSLMIALQTGPRIVLVRVHGNHTLPDAEVLEIAGVARGDAFDAGIVQEIEDRLLASGKFDAAEVRVRYRGLSESEDVALVIVVREKPSAASRFMVGPIFGVSNEYGVTFGGRLALVDVATDGGLLSFPLSWGGKRQAGLEGRFPLGGERHLRVELSRWREVHPSFDIPENRLELGGEFLVRVERSTLAVRAKWSDVDFGRPHQRFAELGAGATVDTRLDPTIPGDAGYLGLDWRRIFVLAGSDGADVHQYTLDLRGYKRLVGQALVATQVYWAIASGPVPTHEQPFVGGGATLRGYEPGRFIGDNAAHASFELRLPLTSTTAFGNAGVFFFYDIGTAYDDGKSVTRAHFRDAFGVGAFFKFLVGLRVDVGWDMKGNSRIGVATSMKF